MRKIITVIIMCIIITTTIGVNASEDVNIKIGFAVNFNEKETDFDSVIYNNTHYVPFRKVFEMMDSVVFFRQRDNKILVLSRDGDTITHTVGENIITVNGVQKTVENPSFFIDEQTYIPIDMVALALCPDKIYYKNKQLHIQKQLVTNQYHKVIREVLDVAKNENFYPERFKRYKDYHGKNPAYSMDDVIFRVNLGLDYPFYENIKVTDNPYDYLVLVNKYNQLPSGFSHQNLVNMDNKYILNDGKQYLLEQTAYEKYINLWEDAKEQGLTMRVVSAYRTEDYQRNLYNNKVKASGKIYADMYSARAGHSEHQLGLAIDISSTKTVFEYTKEFEWLQKHAHEYGYIMRYPKDKEWITGYAYEPWHYRYVGVDVATAIHNMDITYEEYYSKYIDVNEFK